MKMYEVIRRQFAHSGTTYHRGDKVLLSDEVYLSNQRSLKLLEDIIKTNKNKQITSKKIV